MYTDILCSLIEKLEIRKEFRELEGINKVIIEYLLEEVKEAIKNNQIFIRRPVKQSIPLFEIKFQGCGGVFIFTRHRYGSAHVKYFKECRPKDVDSVIHTIEFICETLEWEVIPENFLTMGHSQTLEIRYKFQEEATR